MEGMSAEKIEKLYETKSQGRGRITCEENKAKESNESVHSPRDILSRFGNVQGIKKSPLWRFLETSDEFSK